MVRERNVVSEEGPEKYCLKMEEDASSQGISVTFSRWKRQGNKFSPLEPLEETKALLTP